MDCFDRWFHVPNELSLESCRYYLMSFVLNMKKLAKSSLEMTIVTLNILKQLMHGLIIDVTKHQLNDFFLGGLRQSMSHCSKLTNL